MNGKTPEKKEKLTEEFNGQAAIRKAASGLIWGVLAGTFFGTGMSTFGTAPAVASLMLAGAVAAGIRAMAVTGGGLREIDGLLRQAAVKEADNPSQSAPKPAEPS